MVNKRRSGFQCDFRWGGKRVRRMFPTEHEALAWEAHAKERLSKGAPIDDVIDTPTGGTTLADLLEITLSRYWAGTANEADAYRNGNEVVDLIGADRDVRSVTTTDIDNVVAALEQKGNSAATINRKLAAIGKMMTHAVSRGLIDRKPHIEMKREARGRLRWYSNDEIARIMAAASAACADFHDVLVFLLNTGCRLSEARGTRWADVGGKFVQFHRTKNGQRRSVPVSPDLRAMLDHRRAQLAPGAQDPVFPGWSNSTASRAWAEVREAVGLTDDDEAVLHTFRHTCASRLAQAGVPIQIVQQWLGHKTLTMTLRYAHLAPHNLLDAVPALDWSVTTCPDKLRSQSDDAETDTAWSHGDQEGADAVDEVAVGRE